MIGTIPKKTNPSEDLERMLARLSLQPDETDIERLLRLRNLADKLGMVKDSSCAVQEREVLLILKDYIRLDQLAYDTHDHFTALKIAQHVANPEQLADLDKSKRSVIARNNALYTNGQKSEVETIKATEKENRAELYRTVGKILFAHELYKAASVAYARANAVPSIVAVFSHYLLEHDTKNAIDIIETYKSIIKSSEPAIEIMKALVEGVDENPENQYFVERITKILSLDYQSKHGDVLPITSTTTTGPEMTLSLLSPTKDTARRLKALELSQVS